jgi:hypothetical protein
MEINDGGGEKKYTSKAGRGEIFFQLSLNISYSFFFSDMKIEVKLIFEVHD